MKKVYNEGRIVADNYGPHHRRQASRIYFLAYMTIGTVIILSILMISFLTGKAWMRGLVFTVPYFMLAGAAFIKTKQERKDIERINATIEENYFRQLTEESLRELDAEFPTNQAEDIS